MAFQNSREMLACRSFCSTSTNHSSRTECRPWALKTSTAARSSSSFGGTAPLVREDAWSAGNGIEELCQKREELCRQIQQEEDEKQRLQSEVRQLTEKLARVNENLARKIASRNEFDRTIAETEAAYLKILESSQTLLSVLKREAGNLTKGTASEQKSSGGKEGELMRP
uniref:SS nuclear autoantigen 1 n=1 Tax=Suricata suricatta TaxID=37032 RepID=A0A673VLA0_SURSU